ncbi:hypothetical protein, partial [Gramella sp. KN1008]|uniref:PIN domain-containing protein n=1 Tax=Gramella sp. KN1008 TaxID=2529298 RepID=UPI0013F14EBB
MLGKIAINILAKYGQEKIKDFYTDDRTAYEKELTAIIDRTTSKFSENFDTRDSEGKYSFIKSRAVIESLLKFSLSKEFDRENLFAIIKQERNVYAPTIDELTFFVETFENEISKSEKLQDFHVKDNFHEEIFLLGEKLSTLLGLTYGIKEDTQEIKENIHVFSSLLTGLNRTFHNQVEEIKKCAERFQVETALHLIEGLEKELDQQNFNDEGIRSKLLFLKAYCLKEINKGSNLEFAKLFVQAYLKDSKDLAIMQQAAVAYLNLKEQKDAVKVANKILQQEPFDLTAWIVKSITSKDLKEYLIKVPEVVKKSKGFQISIAYYLMLKNKELNVGYLEDLGVNLIIDEKLLPELTLFTKDIWNINIDLLYNLESGNRLRRYVAGHDFLYETNQYSDLLVKILKNYVAKLDNTEVHSRILEYKFILNFYLYAITNDHSYSRELDKVFSLIKKDPLKLTQYCQIQNHQKEYSKSLEAFEDFKEKNSDFPLDILVFQIHTLLISGNKEKAIKEIRFYINSIPVIDYSRIHNLKGILFSSLNELKDLEIKDIVELISKKEYSEDTLKILVKIELKLVLGEPSELEKQSFYEELYQIEDKANTENLHLFLHSYMLLNKVKEAIKLCTNYITDFEKATIESLKLYVLALLEMVSIRIEHEKVECDYHSVLLELLEHFRKKIKPIDINFLKQELELYRAVEDWSTILEISSLLYKMDPSDEYNIANYLFSLKENKDYIKLKEVSQKIPDQFKVEAYGINVAQVLINSNVNVNKGFEIAYRLALDTKNTQSRLFYFGTSLTNREKFEDYKIVKADAYVEFSTNKEIFIEYIDQDHEWIGKEIGSNITEKENLSNTFTNITILHCFNQYVKLYKEILKESNNPINKLGIKQFNIDSSSKEGFEEQLKNLFGFQGEEDERFQKKLLEEYSTYKTGFITIANSLFKQDFWSTDKFLKTHHTYQVLPKVFFGDPPINKETLFILDYTSVCTLYDFQKKFGLPPSEKKFLISNLIPTIIERLIEEEEKKSSTESFNLKITTKNVIPNFKPENFSKSKIEDLKGLLEWIDKHCKTTIVREKIDVVFKLENNKTNPLTKSLIDNIFLSNRENHLLVTDDVFYALNFGKLNMISSEILLLSLVNKSMYPKLYSYFLENHFVGITVEKDLLLEKFRNYIAGKDSHYLTALKSLSQDLNPHPNKISVVSNLIKDMYLINGLTLETKNSHVHNLLLAVFPGCTQVFRSQLLDETKNLLKLTGHIFDEFNVTFKVAENQFLNHLF